MHASKDLRTNQKKSSRRALVRSQDDEEHLNPADCRQEEGKFAYNHFVVVSDDCRVTVAPARFVFAVYGLDAPEFGFNLAGIELAEVHVAFALILFIVIYRTHTPIVPTRSQLSSVTGGCHFAFWTLFASYTKTDCALGPQKFHPILSFQN